MKHFTKKYLLLSLTALSILASCRKDNNHPTLEQPTAQRQGIFILNEGLFNHNNSTLTYYDYTSKQVTADQFSTANGGSVLGDTGNDLEVYGSKMYIVVNVSSSLEVVNAKSAKSIKHIDLKANGIGRQPRYIVFNGSKAYISSYDGTVAVLDTASLAIEKYITVGRNPEHMAIANGKLYVANSGGLSYPNYDNTVSVIDLATQTETKKVTVAANPQEVAADTYGNVYVKSAGNYSTVQPTLTILSSNNDAVTSQAQFDGSSMFLMGDNLYFLTSDKKVKVYNVKTQQTTANFITDGTVITTPYGLRVDGSTGEVFVTDAKDYVSNGTLTAFDKSGKKEYTINAGINPGKIALVSK